MGMLKAVLFDLDNTLLDRTQSFYNFARHFVAEYFPQITGLSVEELVGRIVELDEDGYRSKPSLFGQLLKELPFAEGITVDKLTDFYHMHYPCCALAMAGSEQVLDFCSQEHLAIGLVTNGQTAIQLGKLERLGWSERFDAVLVSEAAGCKKPDPAIFRKALALLGVGPEEAVFVGDHPANDIGGAAAAGIPAVWLRRNQPLRDGAAAPMLTIDGLEQLHPWLAAQLADAGGRP